MIVNYTDTDTWTVEDIISALSDTPNKKRKITIPKFQRTLVWTKNQQKDFIDSIKQGFPVGAILLYKLNDKDGNTMFSLIDGLQRSTAINQYIKAPTQFFDETNLSKELINEILTLATSKGLPLTEEDISKVIISWITTLKGFQESDGFSSYNLSSHLDEIFSLNLSKIEVSKTHSLFIPFLESIKSESNISQFKIPFLIYTGDQSHLPTIFERLNSKGTQLSKYQIYAATWVTYPHFKIDNREIILGIKNKYDLLLEEGYEVENYDPSPKFFTSEFSTFEYLFGFGKHLCSKYPYLFNGSSKSEQEDSIGFNVTNICLGLPFNRMSEIPSKLKNYNTVAFEQSIISSIDFVFNSLKGHITLKMNSQNSRTKVSIVHTELQIVSMIGKVFHSKYNEDLTEKSSWNTTSEKLKANLSYHYLYDIIKGNWKGSGDSRAFDLISSDRYEQVIAKITWDSALTDWFNEDLSKKEKTRINLKESSILFYKYLYSYSLSAYEEISSITYEIEHLIPVDKLKQIAEPNGIPISAFPNLCLLDKSLNRSKGSLTFYQYFKKQVTNAELTQSQSDIEIKNIEKYTHTTEADMDFVDQDFTVDQYINFLNNRFVVIKELFYGLNNIV